MIKKRKRWRRRRKEGVDKAGSENGREEEKCIAKYAFNRVTYALLLEVLQDFPGFGSIYLMHTMNI